MKRIGLGVLFGLLTLAAVALVVMACEAPPKPSCAEGQIEVSPAVWVEAIEGHYIYADKVQAVDQEGYYSCSQGYTLVDGNMCHKHGRQDKPATWNEPTYKMVCPEGYDKHGNDCRAFIEGAPGYWIAPVCREPIAGCMDEAALNFNAAAEIDDGTCEYAPEPVLGCTDPEALNYDENATQDDGTCQFEQPTEEPTEIIPTEVPTEAPPAVVHTRSTPLPKSAW